MITISNLAMQYGARLLFSEVNLELTQSKRYGLVGANGSGKSTFFKLIMQEEEPSDGLINIHKNYRVGALRQDQFLFENTSIINSVIAGNKVLWQALCKKDEVISKYRAKSKNKNIDQNADNNAEFSDFTMTTEDGYLLADLESIILDHDGYNANIFASELLVGLGIDEKYHYNNLSSLSGGYKLRVLLAQSLFNNPDILLLDEPTNHLDIVSIYWLENYLKEKFKGLIIFISHDAMFLNNIATHILDIDYGEIRQYTGNYKRFLTEKEHVAEIKLKDAEYIAKKISKMQSFIDKFKAGTRSRQAKSKERQIEKIELPDVTKSSRLNPNFTFNQKRASGKLVLNLANISKSYLDRKIFSDTTFDIQKGDKLVVIGPNGSGKSTLLKIILGKVEKDSGFYEWGHETHISYFAQDHHELLNQSMSVLDWLSKHCTKSNTNELRGALGAMLFSNDEINKNILRLSGGEQARLLFAKIMLEESNILVLDEPTNHLDLESKENLKKALINYKGTLILVTHDRDFAVAIADRIIALGRKKLIDFKGSYLEYLSKYSSDYLSSEWILTNK